MAEVPAWDPEAGAPGYMYVKVADHIAARIAAGDLAPNAMLPGEQEMAAGYGVAIGTIRSAVRLLRDRGLVVTLPSKGTYVTGPPTRQ